MYKLSVLLAFVLPSFLMSQIDYGNEWIDYNRQYYHFSVLNSGVHKISYEVMNNAGIPVNSISPNEFQVFGREKEVAIRVIDGGDSSFDPGDYIEFIAQRNDGWLDSVLYTEPEHIGNPAYSLYNDTLFYYLTWRPGNNKRYIVESDINFNNYTPTPYVFQKRTVNFNNQYYGGFSQFSSYSSFFVAGEGWGGPNYNGASGFALPISVNTPSPYTGSGAPPVTFHGKSMANSNANFTGQGNHHLRWEVGSSNALLYDEIFVGYRQTVVDETFSVGLINDGNSTITFRIVGDQGATTDFQSVQYLELEYPRTLNMNNANGASFRVENSANEAKIRLDITNSNLTNPICYVRGGGVDRFIPMVENSGVWQALIPNSPNGQPQQVSVFSENSLTNVNQLTSINGNGFFTDFSSLNFEEAFLMIYPNVLSSASSQYAAYRSKWCWRRL